MSEPSTDFANCRRGFAAKTSQRPMCVQCASTKFLKTLRRHYGPTPSSAYTIHHGMWYVVCGMWYVVCGIWYVVCGMWYVVCGMWYVAYGIHTTYHIPHTTYHIPHTTYHIPHTKVYSIGRTWSWPVMLAPSSIHRGLEWSQCLNRVSV